MLELLPARERYVCNERIVSRDEYLRYKKKQVRIVAHVVCKQCNHGWMSDIEQALKPILKDAFFDENPRIFTQGELATIAAFAFKTLILANHKDLKASPFFPSSDRFRFRSDLRIPPGIQIWMATRETVTGKYYGFWKSCGGKSDPHPAHRSFGFANYICTWNFQNIVLQIVASKWQDKRRRDTVPPMSFPEDEYWKHAAVLIWPLPHSFVQWPPLFYLGDRSLENFRDRFDTIKVSFS